MVRWALLMLMGCLASIGTAHADQAFEVVQLVCAPDAQYFSASRQWVSDITPNFDQRTPLFALVSPESLERQPFLCKWKNHSIAVKRVQLNPRVPEGPCGSYDVPVEVTLDGSHLACLPGASAPEFDSRTTLLVYAVGVPPNSSDIFVQSCGASHCETDDAKTRHPQ